VAVGLNNDEATAATTDGHLPPALCLDLGSLGRLHADGGEALQEDVDAGLRVILGRGIRAAVEEVLREFLQEFRWQVFVAFPGVPDVFEQSWKIRMVTWGRS